MLVVQKKQKQNDRRNKTPVTIDNDSYYFFSILRTSQKNETAPRILYNTVYRKTTKHIQAA